MLKAQYNNYQSSRRFNVAVSNVAIPFFLVLLAWLVVGDIIGEPSRLPGIDTYWHVTLIDEGADRLSAGQPIGPIAETINAGRSYMYDTNSAYPQFVYWLAVPLAVLLGDPGRAYGFMMFMALAMAQLSFYFGFRRRVGIPGAVFGAIAFAFAPYTLTAISVQGRFPAIMSMSFIPLVLSGLLNLVDRPDKRSFTSALTGSAAASAFHPMVFYMAAIPIGVVVFLFAIGMRVGPRRFGFTMATIAIGVLCAWVLIPDGISDVSQRGGVVSIVTQFEEFGRRTDAGLDNPIVPFSIRWNSFDVSLRFDNLNYAGVGLAAAAILVIALVRTRSVLLFGFGAGFAYFLATGPIVPFWDQIPLANSLEPRRFLYPAYLLVAVTLAVGVSTSLSNVRENLNRKQIVVYGAVGVVVVSLIGYDAAPLAGRITPYFDGQKDNWTDRINESGADGRLYWNAVGDFSPYYFGGRQTDSGVVSRFDTVIRALVSEFPETSITELAHLNVRSVLTDENVFPALPVELQKNGFVETSRWDSRVLLTTTKDGSMFMNQDVSVGLVGVAANQYWRNVFTNSAAIPNPDALDQVLINSFDILVFSSFAIENTEDLEAKLTEYLQQGGSIVIEEPNRSGRPLFDWGFTQQSVPRDFSVGDIQALPFEIDGNEFRGVRYDDLGEVVLTGTTPEGEPVPLIQKRELAGGAIYAVCCNVGNHISETGDTGLADVFRQYFAEEIGGYGNIWPTKFEAEIEQGGPSNFVINYTSEERVPVLISLRLPEKRQMTVSNGEQLPLYSIGLIQAAVLPAGTHTATLTTKSNLISPVVLMIWIIGLAAAVLVATRAWNIATLLGDSYSALSLRMIDFGVGLSSRLVKPKWATEQVVDGAVIRIAYMTEHQLIDLIRIGTHAQPDRFEAEQPLRPLRSVFISVQNESGSRTTFNADDLRLIDKNGNAITPVAPTMQAVPTSAEFKLFELLGRSQAYLIGDIEISRGETVEGHVMFSGGEVPAIGLQIASGQLITL